MDLDIETEHVLMRSEWHRTIEEWTARCAKAYPELVAVYLRLRHAERARAANRVDAIARAGGCTLQAAADGESMTVALRNALDTLERELMDLRGRRDRPKAA